ncbi:class I SAM-dependent methyltransferase [Occultella aeris]|uniref:Malonyl-[acyl-carrier protein] O-methyltransferase n=2 Tax=Occultella aeris TaxID=2761496 RepID=A0A7M4DDS4_9MICO|nr:methyltransferase domain-containing protein [Occultella aeris]VZO34995.1 Malonyl-[acyl-carrier protein] O-methyltransferase [Occultella aeris]
MTEHARSFDRAAAVYAATRPSYPPAAVDWLVPRSARRVLDLAAGTGKLTRLLVDRGGLEVVAVDPAPNMLGELHEHVPGVPTFVGTAENLPLPDDAVDVVTVAQAWHWVDPAAAVPEIARVLRPGGTLGLVWNSRDESVAWVAEFGDILIRLYERDEQELAPDIGAPFGPVESTTIRWTQAMPAETLVDLVRSRSYFITATPEQQADVLGAVGDLLAGHAELAGRDVIDLPYLADCFRTRLDA